MTLPITVLIRFWRVLTADKEVYNTLMSEASVRIDNLNKALQDVTAESLILRDVDEKLQEKDHSVGKEKSVIVY